MCGKFLQSVIFFSVQHEDVLTHTVATAPQIMATAPSEFEEEHLNVQKSSTSNPISIRNLYFFFVYEGRLKTPQGEL